MKHSHTAQLRTFFVPGRVRLIPAILVCALSVGAVPACGGQDTPPATGTPATTSTTPGASTTPVTSTTPVNVAADKAKARTLLLKPSDLPATWKATPDQRTAEDKALDEALAACLGRPSPATYNTADIDSPDFTLGNAEASSQTQIVRTIEDFKADVAAAGGPKYLPCAKGILTQAVRRQLQAQGASLQSLSVEPLRVPRYGQFSMGIRTTVKYMIQGQAGSTLIDTILLGKDRIELSISLSNADRPFDPALASALVAKLGSRLDAA